MDTPEEIVGSSVEMPCDYEGCANSALVFSDPPRCLDHIDDLDKWYANTLEQLHSKDLPLSEQQVLLFGAFARNGYLSSLLLDPTRRRIYTEHKNRYDPRDNIHFSFEDIIYFAVAAMASGIIGNLAYDVLKEAISRIAARHGNKDLENEYEKKFEVYISFRDYEKLRDTYHEGLAAESEIPDGMESEINTKYVLIIENRIPDDANEADSAESE